MSLQDRLYQHSTESLKRNIAVAFAMRAISLASIGRFDVALLDYARALGNGIKKRDPLMQGLAFSRRMVKHFLANRLDPHEVEQLICWEPSYLIVARGVILWKTGRKKRSFVWAMDWVASLANCEGWQWEIRNQGLALLCPPFDIELHEYDGKSVRLLTKVAAAGINVG